MKIKVAAYFPRPTWDATGSVCITHVVYVAKKLQFVVHGRDHSIKTVGDESDLFLILSVAGQRLDSDVSELGEEFLDTRCFLNEPFK